MQAVKMVVAPREGRVSRNACNLHLAVLLEVAPREGRVSRNVFDALGVLEGRLSRPARGV